LVGESEMPTYNVDICRKLRRDKEGNIKTEIWAEIEDAATGTITNKLIWWEDDEGIYHDETPELPTDLRKVVDKMWLEKRRAW